MNERCNLEVNVLAARYFKPCVNGDLMYGSLRLSDFSNSALEARPLSPPPKPNLTTQTGSNDVDSRKDAPRYFSYPRSLTCHQLIISITLERLTKQLSFTSEDYFPVIDHMD